MSCHRAPSSGFTGGRGYLFLLAGRILYFLQGSAVVLYPPYAENPFSVQDSTLCTHVHFRTYQLLCIGQTSQQLGPVEKTQTLELERPGFKSWFCAFPVFRPQPMCDFREPQSWFLNWSHCYLPDKDVLRIAAAFVRKAAPSGRCSVIASPVTRAGTCRSCRSHTFSWAGLAASIRKPGSADDQKCRSSFLMSLGF